MGCHFVDYSSLITANIIIFPLSSLLIQLRCQVHTEVAKCEEDQEQIEVAIKHLHKVMQRNKYSENAPWIKKNYNKITKLFITWQAQALDDGAVYKDRLDVALHRLELRATLYSTPERPEDQAAMIIEQVVSIQFHQLQNASDSIVDFDTLKFWVSRI